MQQPPSTLRTDREYYAKLGRLLVAIRTDVAQELTEAYFASSPTGADLSLLPRYLTLFCQSQGIPATQITGAKHKAHPGNEKRRLFIAAMARLYYPHAFRRPSARVRMRSGFIVAIADLMGCDKSNMNKTIREVVAWHANYDEFRASVDEVVAKIKAA